MLGDAWLRWAVAVVMVATAAYHVARLSTVRLPSPAARHVDVEVAHAAMAVAMTGMLVGSFSDGSAGRWWAAGFGLASVWFVGRGTYGYVMDGAGGFGPRAREAVCCAAMAYMLVAAGSTVALTMSPAKSGMTHMVAAHHGVGVALGMALLLVMVAVSLASVRAVVVRSACSPAAAGCQFALNVATVYMLAAVV